MIILMVVIFKKMAVLKLKRIKEFLWDKVSNISSQAGVYLQAGFTCVYW